MPREEHDDAEEPEIPNKHGTCKQVGKRDRREHQGRGRQGIPWLLILHRLLLSQLLLSVRKSWLRCKKMNSMDTNNSQIQIANTMSLKKEKIWSSRRFLWEIEARNCFAELLNPSMWKYKQIIGCKCESRKKWKRRVPEQRKLSVFLFVRHPTVVVQITKSDTKLPHWTV